MAGTLAGEDLERFEVHLLECALCRSEVELGMSIRAAGKLAPVRRGPRWVLPAVSLAAAAAVTLFVLRPESDRTRFESLGEVLAPPVYLGIPVRADEREARFDAAMQAYNVGDYARAIDQLNILAGELNAAPVHFFRGASAMMIGSDSLALAAYEALLDLTESPYHDEGRYYHAKVSLRRGLAARARADLRAIRDPAMRAQADALADSIGALGVR